MWGWPQYVVAGWIAVEAIYSLRKPELAVAAISCGILGGVAYALHAGGFW